MFFPKQFTVRGSQFFLKMCPPFVSLLVSALFRWPCSVSIHLSPKAVTAGVDSSPELGNKSKGLQGRGGHSSSELMLRIASEIKGDRRETRRTQ